MSFPKLDENPIINLSASGPHVRQLGSFSGDVTLGFDSLRVISAGGGVQLHEDVTITFSVNNGEPDVYRLAVEQPFEPYGRSRRPASAGAYRVQLPWWMLAPLLSVPAGSTVQVEFTADSASIFVAPAGGSR